MKEKEGRKPGEYPGSGMRLRVSEVRKLLYAEDWENDPNDKHQQVRRVWIGTIFGVTPSGKMYMPFACSNVMGCDACAGTGQIPNHKARVSRALARSPRYEDRRRAYRSCTACCGMGSREAYLDELWNDYVSKLADDIDAFADWNDGDLFISQCRDKPEEEEEDTDDDNGATDQSASP
jgi:hypothetical protein